jgi:hypothetical protein
MDPNMASIVEDFFLSNGTQPIFFGNGTRPDIPMACPTSSCTWPPYETLGVCNQCTEAPQLLAHTCTKVRIDWTSGLVSTISSYPNATACGHFVNATSDDPVLFSGYTVGPKRQHSKAKL